MKNLIILFPIIFGLQPVFGQLGFNAPDTVCVNAPVSITNTSIGGASYFWNFCVADVATTIPNGFNLGNVGFSLQLPVFMDIAQYNNNFYGFVINNSPGRLIRLDFGNSLLNTPTAVNLGNFSGAVPDAAEGIQVVQSGGNWFAIIVGGNINTGERISKLEFGPNLANPNPVATNWGNLGNMAYPVDLHVFNENNNWYGFTLNSANSTITRFNFGANFANPPQAVNFGNIGNLNGPTGINAIKDNNNWYVFITNETSSTLTRLEFGNSLLNTPTGLNIGNPNNNLNGPRDLYLMKFCGSIVGVAVNKVSNDIIKFNFNQDINSIPSSASLGNLGNLSFPHSISRLFRVNNELYSFITNVNNNTITRLEFKGCNNNNIPNSSVFTPPTYTYSIPGTYNISLTVDEGLPTQASICKTIVVLPKPKNVPYKDTSFCFGKPLNISSSVNAPSYLWNTNAITKSINTTSGGQYIVDANYYGCSLKDTINASVVPLPKVFLGGDTSICSSTGYILDAGNAGASFVWQDGTNKQTLEVFASGTYHVTVDLSGCKTSDTININIASPQKFSLGQDTAICNGSAYNISPSNPALSYIWQDGSTKSIFITLQAGTYYATATSCNVTISDTVVVSIKPKPTVFLGGDTTICSTGSFVLDAGNSGANFQWHDGSTSQTYSVTSSGKYFVRVSQQGCVSSDTIVINYSGLPSLYLGRDTILCEGNTITLRPTNNVSPLRWQDGTVAGSFLAMSTGTYHATYASGCGIISDTIVLKSGSCDVYVPSAFTPNKDGRNDFFKLLETGSVQSIHFQVFSRWGEKLFETFDKYIGWDGTVRGVPQSSGAFIYKIVYKKSGEQKPYNLKGTFILIR